MTTNKRRAAKYLFDNKMVQKFQILPYEKSYIFCKG